MYDVIVVGAGPAGLVASEKLAAAGHRVLVCEEHDEVGAPVHCTGVLAAEALAPLAVPHDAILNALATVKFIAPSGESFEYTSGVPLPTPSGFMTGTYGMASVNGEAFDIAIPTFSLDSPESKRTIN